MVWAEIQGQLFLQDSFFNLVFLCDGGSGGFEMGSHCVDQVDPVLTEPACLWLLHTRIKCVKPHVLLISF